MFFFLLLLLLFFISFIWIKSFAIVNLDILYDHMDLKDLKMNLIYIIGL